MDDVALLEHVKALTSLYVGEPVSEAADELVRRFEPHAQAPDHQDYPFIADEENLK